MYFICIFPIASLCVPETRIILASLSPLLLRLRSLHPWSPPPLPATPPLACGTERPFPLSLRLRQCHPAALAWSLTPCLTESLWGSSVACGVFRERASWPVSLGPPHGHHAVPCSLSRLPWLFLFPLSVVSAVMPGELHKPAEQLGTFRSPPVHQH